MMTNAQRAARMRLEDRAEEAQRLELDAYDAARFIGRKPLLTDDEHAARTACITQAEGHAIARKLAQRLLAVAAGTAPGLWCDVCQTWHEQDGWGGRIKASCAMARDQNDEPTPEEAHEQRVRALTY